MTFSASHQVTDSRLSWGILGGAILVLIGIVVAVTWPLRSALHQQVLRREASAMAAVVEIQTETGTQLIRDLGAELEVLDLFYALLESPRLEDVVAMQMFESNGSIVFAVPDSAFVETLPSAERLALAQAHYHSDSSSAGGMGWGQEATAGPWLEVIVPITDGESEGPAWVRYWLDGADVALEFAEIDQRLWRQAGTSAGAGSLLLALGLGWAFAKLRRRTADLARANQELLLNSKTAAIGAISAHLMHGLNNPLAGLEGFISDESQERRGDASTGEAWAEAAETTRRVRRLVHEVMAVLQDEAAGVDYAVTVNELLETAAANARANPAAAELNIVVTTVEPEINLSGRVASLAGLVIPNLLDNAIAATASGGRIDLKAKAATAQAICIQIRDTGGGLPADVQAAAFAPITSRKPGGAGIGLALSGALAKHAGGELRVISSDSRGTCFGLDLPLHSSTDNIENLHAS
ncbi:MAG: sensor histidine kinase [Verrucomicrobiia bacterium]